MLKDDFLKYQAKTTPNPLGINVAKAKDYNKEILKISESEIKKHKDFIKSELKKNFY